jgi:Bacterial Ig-like domain
VIRVCLYAAALATLVVGVPFAGGATAAAPPAPTIDSAPRQYTNATAAAFSFTDTNPLVTFQCELDGGGFAPCTSGVIYVGLSEGQHTFGVKAVDTLTNESAVTSYTWTVDTTPPPPPVITGPPSPSNSSSATFSFADADPTVSFHCNLDAHGFPKCSNPQTFTGLADGAHTLSARAVDAAGNESSVSSYTWAIDTKPPPQPTIVSGPPQPSGASDAQFAFSDPEAGVGYRCQLDGGGFLSCPNPQTYLSLSDGTHTVVVEAVDAAGNVSDPTPPYSWLIDTVRPVVALTDKPAPVTNRRSATFSFSSNKPGSTFACALDGSGYSACTSPILYTDRADGSHTFAVRASQLGNTGPATSYDWTVDTVPPDTSVASGPPADATTASASFTFTSSETGSTFACSLDAAGFAPCTSPKTYEGLGDGSHTFRVQGVDVAGNADPTPASYIWRISGVGPGTADHTPPGNVTRLKRAVRYGVLRLAWTRPPDADFDHVGVFVSTSVKSPARAAVYQGAASAYVEKRFRNGFYYRFTVVSYDHAGNASRGASTVVSASALLRSPGDGAVVREPPRLVWNAVPRASFYNAQLYYGTKKVLSTWPRRPRVQLGRGWSYAGRRFGLNKGLYHWYVWPAFGPRPRSRYGQLLGQATFRVR